MKVNYNIILLIFICLTIGVGCSKSSDIGGGSVETTTIAAEVEDALIMADADAKKVPVDYFLPDVFATSLSKKSLLQKTLLISAAVPEPFCTIPEFNIQVCIDTLDGVITVDTLIHYDEDGTTPMPIEEYYPELEYGLVMISHQIITKQADAYSSRIEYRIENKYDGNEYQQTAVGAGEIKLTANQNIWSLDSIHLYSTGSLSAFNYQKKFVQLSWFDGDLSTEFELETSSSLVSLPAEWGISDLARSYSEVELDDSVHVGYFVLPDGESSHFLTTKGRTFTE